MSFPVKANELRDIDVTSDEQASFVVIESILNSTFDEIDLNQGIDRKEFKHRVVSHEKFDEISNSIVDQKKILNSILGDNKTKSNVSKLLEIQANALSSINQNIVLEEKKSSNVLRYASAACLLIVFVSLSSYSMFAIKKTHESRNTPVESVEKSQINTSSDNRAGITSDSSQDSTNYSTSSDSVPGTSTSEYTTAEIVSLTTIAVIFVSLVIFAYFFITKKIQNKKKIEEESGNTFQLRSNSFLKISIAAGLIIIVALSTISILAHNRHEDANTDTTVNYASKDRSSTTEPPKTSSIELGTASPQLALLSSYASAESLKSSIKANKSILKTRFVNNENAVENYDSDSSIDGIDLKDLFFCENVNKTYANYSVFTTKIDSDNVYVLIGKDDSKVVAKIYQECDIISTINLD